MQNDTVNHPAHYTSGGVECIKAIDAAVYDLQGIEAVYVGNIIKYTWRYRKKNGIEDMKKARWYLGALINKLSQESEAKHD